MVSTGDIVRVTRNDGKIYDCFVIEDYKNRNMFYGRVLDSSKDEVSCSSWDRYDLNNNGVCQLIGECKSIRKLSSSKVEVFEDLNDTKVYHNTTPDGKPLTFCLSEDFGGWSEDRDDSISIFESYSTSRLKRREVLGDAC